MHLSTSKAITLPKAAYELSVMKADNVQGDLELSAQIRALRKELNGAAADATPTPSNG